MEGVVLAVQGWSIMREGNPVDMVDGGGQDGELFTPRRL